MTLDNGLVGRRYILISIEDQTIAQQLSAMGIRSGTYLEILRKTWNKRTLSVNADGITLAFRKKEAASLIVESELM